jgi:hypothetical protein
LLLRKPPPDEIAFAPVLSKPPFRDSTFAASIYGGTLAYFNKNCVRGIVSGSSLLGMTMKCSGSTVMPGNFPSPVTWLSAVFEGPAFLMLGDR